MTEVAEQFTEERRAKSSANHALDRRAVASRARRDAAARSTTRPPASQTGEVDFASVEEVDAAVQAAKRAFASWRTISLSRRTELFFRIRELFHEHPRTSPAPHAEHGKVLSDAKGEVARGLEVIEFCCGIPELLKGGYSEQASTGIDVYSIRQPLGVVAGITPFNFPAMVPMWMWAPAIACGNTFVLKPSEKDPSASMLTAELLKEAGAPGRRLQRRARRQGRGRRGARASGDRRGQLRRLDADRALRLRDRHDGTASACRRSAGRRTT